MCNKDFKEMCIEKIKECAKENGGYLSSNLYRQSKKLPTCSQIINTFGSWNTAVKAADIMSKEEFKELCKDAVKECFEQYPDCPSAEVYDWYINEKNYVDYPTSTQIIRALGRWEKALQELGLWNIVLATYTKEICSKQIEQCALANNGNVTMELYTDYRKAVLKQEPRLPVPSLDIIVAVYGSWRNALKEVNLSDIQGKLLLEHFKKEQRAIREFQAKSEIRNPYFR